MSVLILVVKPVLLKLAASPEVKNLVIELLGKYVRSTDNSIDDVIYNTVKELLYKPQQ